MSGGIRINELRLAGSATSQRSYGASFRSRPGGSFLPLSVIAGPTQTGKSSIADFIKPGSTDEVVGLSVPQREDVLAGVENGACRRLPFTAPEGHLSDATLSHVVGGVGGVR